MDKKVIISVLVIGLIGFMFVKSTKSNQCNAKDNGSCQTKKVEQMTAKKVLKQVEANKALLVDVREGVEFKAGHAEKAINYPLSKLIKQQTDLNKNKKIFVYCRSGNRSNTATKILTKRGYQVVDLGGLSDWQAIGGKIVK